VETKFGHPGYAEDLIVENSLKYQVRSREIIDLVSAMRSGRLILAPYFQRNLVWRDGHKRDFIDTILKGYPFPQVFLARGPIDMESMAASTCVVDGQQRLTAIREFVSGEIDANGVYFSGLSTKEKEEFLKYEVPVIDFDLDVGDPRLKDIFKRLNRTFYSLSTIEKIASEYSSSQFLLVARILSGDFSSKAAASEEEIEQDLLPEIADADAARGEPNAFLVDPGIDNNVLAWMNEKADGPFSALIGNERVFSYYESQRKVPLMFVLNVMATFISGYYNRNAKVKDFLEEYNDIFEAGDGIIGILNEVAQFIEKLDLKNRSIWLNKANFFTLVVEAAWNFDDLSDPGVVSAALADLEADLPADYSLAAREAVNNRTQRLLRGNYVRAALTDRPGIVDLPDQ